MTNSKRIAGLLGPTLIAVAVSEALNLQALIAEGGPGVVHVVYLNGILLFVAGLAIVRAHNVWTGGWPVLVTLTGWIVMLGGLFRMLAPAAGRWTTPDATPVYVLLAAALAVGAFLTFRAYAPEARPRTGGPRHDRT